MVLLCDRVQRKPELVVAKARARAVLVVDHELGEASFLHLLSDHAVAATEAAITDDLIEGLFLVDVLALGLPAQQVGITLDTLLPYPGPGVQLEVGVDREFMALDVQLATPAGAFDANRAVGVDEEWAPGRVA